MSLIRILTQRTDFEELVTDFTMVDSGSSIDTIDWFLEHGHRSNSLRNGFVKAREIAQHIREYYDECQTKNAGSGKHF